MRLEKIDPHRSSLNREGHCWDDRVVTDDAELDRIGSMIGIRVVLAVAYLEYGEIKQYYLVDENRKHYKLYI